VNHTQDIYEALLLQDELQTKYTGGTVFHAYLGEQISDVQAVKGLVKKIVNRFRIPYFTLSPVSASALPRVLEREPGKMLCVQQRDGGLCQNRGVLAAG